MLTDDVSLRDYTGYDDSPKLDFCFSGDLKLAMITLYVVINHNTSIMMPQSHLTELNTIAADLAATINAHMGDYPVVSFFHKTSGPDATWLYAYLVIEVFINENEPASIHSKTHGGVSIHVRSLQQGMELLRQTEVLRQKRDFPYIRLN